MNNEILKGEFTAERHPDETQLLLALEREMPAAEIDAVEQHIGSCWECRARYHEMHRGILAFIEYRDKLYLPELDSAPQDFRQFPTRLNQEAMGGQKVGLLDRIGRRICSFLKFAQVSLQARWVAATALVTAAVIFWTQVLTPPALSASELLAKAAQSQNPPTAAHSEVHQKVRVKSGKTETVREFRWQTGSPIPGATWGTDPENWTAPMTAEGFSQWHDTLSAPKDRVKKSRELWTLDTIAAGGPIKEASIVIHAGDFHPTEQHIRFSDGRRVDIEEVSFDIAEQATAAIPKQPQVRSVTRPAPTQLQPTTAAPTANLDEAELELRYTMFSHHLDDDEDLRISRAADAVVLSGTASSAERVQQLQDALGTMPGVRVSLSAPGSSASLTTAGAGPSTARKVLDGSSVPLLKDRLDSAFASAEARRDFVDSCLSDSDSALSHAWAFKKLADRYTDADRHALKPESQTKLNEMLRAHLEHIGAANAGLNRLLNLLPASQPPAVETPSGWAAGVAALFDLVQRQDSLVAALVAGTQTTNTAAVAAGNFRAGHDEIARLTKQLDPGGGAVK